MDGCRQREVVLEIEQVKLVRKRAKTSLSLCRGCGKATDVIQLIKAADLFGITPCELLEFTRSNGCHFKIGNTGEIYLCLVDLLTAMGRRIKSGTIKLIDEHAR